MGLTRNRSCQRGILGCVVLGMLVILIHQIYTTSQKNVRTICEPGKGTDNKHPSYSVKSATSPELTQKLTDLEILHDDFAKETILTSMKLYEKKMKLLKERKLIKSMRGRPVCSEKSKVGAWCNDPECKAKLPPVGSMEIFQSINKPLRAIHNGIFKRIPEVFGTDKIEMRKYVFLLAISENHYLESQATIQTLHEKVFPHLSNYSFYCYDMGITKEQNYMIRKYGKAIVRPYPFHLLPPRVHLFKNFTWKAILIQAHIDKAEFVVYSDASVRFLANLVPMFEQAKYTGFLMCPGSHSLAQQTSKKMFSYFGDEACSYSSYVEYEGGFLVFHNEPFTRTLLLEPWVACALDPKCMSEDKRFQGCPYVRKYGKCHRYDLSAMTVILVKLFRDNMATFNSPRGRFHTIKQGRTNVTNYLKYLQTKKEVAVF